MRVEKLYDYNKNILDFIRKDSTKYHLELRGKITIIDGDSGTGKTLLSNELSSLKESETSLTGVDLSNIILLKSDKEDIIDDKILYIIDRADMILNDIMCDKICSCSKARFLIFARGSYNLGVSPNHFGRFQKSLNEVSIVYEFNERWW